MEGIFYLIIVLLAFPVGYLLAYLARDEIVAGRKWLIALGIISLVSILPVGIFLFNLPIMLALLFLTIICMIAVWKSHDKKFVKKN